jgi:hypothetical protein
LFVSAEYVWKTSEMPTYRMNPDALSTTVGESLVLFNVESLKYFELNSVGARIVEILTQEPLSADDICAVLLSEYEVSESDCSAEVVRFLGDALEKGLVLSD